MWNVSFLIFLPGLMWILITLRWPRDSCTKHYAFSHSAAHLSSSPPTVEKRPLKATPDTLSLKIFFYKQLKLSKKWACLYLIHRTFTNKRYSKNSLTSVCLLTILIKQCKACRFIKSTHRCTNLHMPRFKPPNYYTPLLLLETHWRTLQSAGSSGRLVSCKLCASSD